MQVQVQSFTGEAGAAIELNDEVFGLDPRADILHRVVTWQLEKRRATARGTRERADVARTGKKLGRQKGGGTARQGDLAKLGFGKRALVIDGDLVDTSFAFAAGNLHEVNVLPAVGANVYDIIKADTLVLTRAAVEKLEARFNG